MSLSLPPPFSLSFSLYVSLSPPVVALRPPTSLPLPLSLSLSQPSARRYLSLSLSLAVLPEGTVVVGLGVGKCRKKLDREIVSIDVILGRFKWGYIGHAKRGCGRKSLVRGISCSQHLMVTFGLICMAYFIRLKMTNYLNCIVVIYHL